MKDTRHAKILIIDDNEQNIELLEAHLTIAGYETVACQDSQEAQKVAEQLNPDLILLDIMMPGINGYEVCKTLKAAEKTKFIPVIMLTALKDIEDKIKGIEAGAEEFLSKPFNKLELLTRVKSLIKIKFLHDELEYRNKELTGALAQIKKVENMKTDLTNMMVHDLKNPLHGLILTLNLLLDEKTGPINEDQKEFITDAKLGTENLLSMVCDMLDITRMEENKMKLVYSEMNVLETAATVAKNLEMSAKENNIHIKIEEIDKDLTLNADTSIIVRVLTNLLSNAIKHSFGDSNVWIGAKQNGNQISIEVKDEGEGIPKEFHDAIFEKFGHVDSKKQGYVFDTGLGLTFCKMAVETHGGKIWVESEEEKGSTFTFSLPQNTTC